MTTVFPSCVQRTSLVLRAGLGVLLLGSLLFASLLAASPARAQQDGVPASEETSSDEGTTSEEGTTTLTIPSDRARASNPSLTVADTARIDSLKLQAAFAAVAENHAVVVRNLTEVLRLTPSDSSLYYQLGTAYDGLWQHEKAAEAYRRAIELGMDTPDVRIEQAISLVVSRQYEEAASILSELLDVYPSNVSLRMGMASALAGLGRADEAADDMAVLYNMYPDNAGIMARYAETLWVAGKQEEAFSVVRAYTEKHPDEPFPRTLLAEMHLRVGEVETAHATLMTAKDRVEQRSSYIRGVIYSGLTYTYARTNQPEKALTHATLALEQATCNPYTYRNQGLAYLANGQNEAACGAFQESLDRGYERMFLEKTQFGPTPSSLLKQHCK